MRNHENIHLNNYVDTTVVVMTECKEQQRIWPHDFLGHATLTV